MRKSYIFILFLLFIVFAEISVLAKGIMRSNESNFVLDTYEIKLPKQEQQIVQETIYLSFPDVEKIKGNLNAFETDIKSGIGYKLSESAEKDIFAKNIADENKNKINAEKLIAIVIDDVGLSDLYVKKIAAIDKPLTTALLPYGASNIKQAEMLRDSGKEIILHAPMMPHVLADLAPVTLSPEMSRVEIQENLIKMLNRFNGVDIVGMNNHMGSLFTERKQPMGYVMEVLKHRKMYFLDSMTTAKSVGKKIAEEFDVPYISRDVFLDNENDYEYIKGQLQEVEKIAQKKGYVIAIGHPRKQTIEALQDWLKSIEDRGFKLVYVSELVRKTNKN